MVSGRLSQGNRDTAPIPSKQAMEILHFTAELTRLADAGQRFHASPSTLDEMSAIRDEISKCKMPLTIYGQNAVYSDGEMLTHGKLILALNDVIIELKLRNSGNGTRDIYMDEVNQIRDLVHDLDQCRKRIVFYR